MMEYVYGGAALAFLSVAGWGYFQMERAEGLTHELERTRGELSSCGTRLQNVIADVKSDGEVDLIPDDQLTDVPEHWMRPGEGAGD